MKCLKLANGKNEHYFFFGQKGFKVNENSDWVHLSKRKKTTGPTKSIFRKKKKLKKIQQVKQFKNCLSS